MDVNLEVDVGTGRAEVDGLREVKALGILLNKDWGRVDVLTVCGKYVRLEGTSRAAGRNQPIWCMVSACVVPDHDKAQRPVRRDARMMSTEEILECWPGRTRERCDC